jgi:hypothetical protein
MKTSALVFTLLFLLVLALGLASVFNGVSITESFSVPHAHIHK